VKHRHLAWFILFFTAMGSFLFGLAGALENRLTLSDNWREVFEAGSTLACGGLLLVGFGFLSRWFERQADVYAARTLEAINTQPNHPQGFGADVFASALQRVAIVNNIPENARNWTHGSIETRVRYIHRLGRDPQVASRFDRTGRYVTLILLFLIPICGAVGVWLMR
jgi:Zn-dependent protease with chaperone function